MYCPSCGNPILKDSQFCMHCGQPVKNAAIDHTKPAVNADAVSAVKVQNTLLCPNCHSFDSIRKVTAIVSADTTITKGQLPGSSSVALPNGSRFDIPTQRETESTTSTILAQKLQQPSIYLLRTKAQELLSEYKPVYPEQPKYPEYPVPENTTSASPSETVQLPNSLDTTRKLLRERAGRIPFAGKKIREVLGPETFKEQVNDYNGQMKTWKESVKALTDEWEERIEARVLSAIQHWHEIYYCSRCDGVFMPNQPKSFESADRLLSLLFWEQAAI